MVSAMIQPLRTDDLGALHALSRDAEAEGFRFLTRFVGDVESGRQPLSSATDSFLGTFVDGKLIAVGGVTADPYISEPNTGRLRHVYVHHTARARGVGRALVRALEELAQTRYRRLRLRTDTEAAAHFYERMGYRRVQDPTATHERVFDTSKPDADLLTTISAIREDHTESASDLSP